MREGDRAWSRIGTLLAILLAVLAVAAATRADAVEVGNIPFPPHISVSPRTLPRNRPAPIKLQFGLRIPRPGGGREPVRLSGFEAELNPDVAIGVEGLARCPLRVLRSSLEKRALELCADAEVGHGNLTTTVPSSGLDQEWESINETVIAFNGRVAGRRSIVLYGASIQPGGGHRAIIIVVRERPAYTSLTSEIPPIADDGGYLSSIDLVFGRGYRAHGTRHSFLAASCALPTGVNIGEFKFARWTEEFDDGSKVTEDLSKTCKASG